MTGTDWIILGIIALLVILGFWYGRKTSCSGNCQSCHGTCTPRKPGEVPEFVKRYRQDHPKHIPNDSPSL